MPSSSVMMMMMMMMVMVMMMMIVVIVLLIVSNTTCLPNITVHVHTFGKSVAFKKCVCVRVCVRARAVCDCV